MPKPSDIRSALARALADVAPAVEVRERTRSTNDDAKDLARAGAAHLTVVVADAQTQGRGRRGRRWEAEPGTALLASWVIRPSLPPERWPVLPLLAGLACAEAVRARTGVAADLKWPNDLLVGDRKLGGILVEAEPPAFAIAGVGINVSQAALPAALAGTATSIALEGGARLDRADLLAGILRSFEAALAEPAAALERYRALCATLGRRVRVLRDRDQMEGVAVDVDAGGALRLRTGAGEETIAAGEVEHLRDAGAP